MTPLRAAVGCDVLYVGGRDLPELDELEASGLRVDRASSVVDALDRMAGATVGVAVVHGDVLGAREAERCDALRRAGVGAVVAVYPPASAWRTLRNRAGGPDFAFALPAPPGALTNAATRLLLAQEAPRPPVAQPEPEVPTATGEAAPDTATSPVCAPATTSPVRTPWMEAAVADASTLHRSLDDVDRLLDRVLAAFVRRSDAERCSILLLDRRRAELRVRRSTLLLDPPDSAPAAPANGLAAHVARVGRPLVVSDVAAPPEDVREILPAQGRDYRTASCALLPLRGAEDVLGVVCLADRRSRRPFTEADLPALEFLAAEAGLALENGLRFRQLQELATVDELTGLANRRQFRTAIEREVQRARRYERQLTLCLLDLDHFKQYNDRCGHPAGDDALATVGEILRTSLRDVDVVARYGGEEFALILPETAARPSGGSRNPFPFLERVRRRIEEAHFAGAERLDGGRLTVSGGVACFPDDAATVDELLREADRQLYVSKSHGRNRITYRDRALAD